MGQGPRTSLGEGARYSPLPRRGALSSEGSGGMLVWCLVGTEDLEQMAINEGFSGISMLCFGRIWIRDRSAR